MISQLWYRNQSISLLRGTCSGKPSPKSDNQLVYSSLWEKMHAVLVNSPSLVVREICSGDWGPINLHLWENHSQETGKHAVYAQLWEKLAQETGN